MINPDVSIIITNYNYGKYLPRCLRSCLSQKNVNCEVIVVDDCSTDMSTEAVKPFLDDIKFIQTPSNVGVAAASNIGMRAAKGQFVIRVDADDYVNADMCFIMMKYLLAFSPLVSV